MKKIILQLSVVVLILSGCANPDSSSQLTENKPVKIGYESDDNGSYEIVNGDLNSLEIVKAYFDAYNNRDLEAVYELEHEDVLLYAPNGIMIGSSKEHLELGKKFMEANQYAKWNIIWSISTHVNFENKPTENWVTSGVFVSSGKDEASKTTVSRVVDLMIKDGKVKKGYIHQRQLSESEKSNLE
jgi:uncharacterized lipoprotein NlpE involved in copper resistance